MFTWAVRKFLNICNFFFFTLAEDSSFHSSMRVLFRGSFSKNLRTSVDNFWIIRLFPHWCVILQFLFLLKMVLQNTTCCFQSCEKSSSFLLVITPFLWILFQQSNSAKGGYKGLTRRKSWQSTKLYLCIYKQLSVAAHYLKIIGSTLFFL